MSTETIFDKIISKEIPADIVYEDEDILAFKDINPQAPIHILVIPKTKVSDFSDLSKLPSHTAGLYIQGVTRVIKALHIKDGYRIVFNSGKHGQQTVNYLHAHILAGKQLHWPPG